jgi:hypothetical protein
MSRARFVVAMLLRRASSWEKQHEPIAFDGARRRQRFSFVQKEIPAGESRDFLECPALET